MIRATALALGYLASACIIGTIVAIGTYVLIGTVAKS